MNISFKWSNRATKCNYCGEMVLIDEPIFVHNWKNKIGYTGRVWYHPNCFGLHYTTILELKVPKPKRLGRGRPSLGLSDEDKRKRAALLRTYPKIKYNEVELAKVAVALEKLGGVPKGWKVREG